MCFWGVPQQAPPPTDYVSNAIWKGFYEQDGTRHDMTFKMFSVTINGDVLGKGKDEVGEFELRGACNEFGDAQFAKRYIGKHTVMYNGKVDNKSMKGTWSVAGMTGNFEISRMPKPWQGHYLQDGNKQEMRFDHFNINRGTIKGKGADVVGEFLITGAVERNGQSRFSKQYVGKHTVQYEGTLTYKEINGKWSMPEHGISDDFQILKAYDETSDIE